MDGQAGGPPALGGGGGGGGFFGGSTGPLRLLNSALGGQAGWLLGVAVVGGIGLIAATRLRRSDHRTGWLIATGGAFLTCAVAFSEAKGIFHPYYVSMLAPFGAALVGATAAQVMSGDRAARIVGPLAVAGAVITELIVLHNSPGQLTWLPPLLVGGGIAAAVALAAGTGARARLAVLAAVFALLVFAPASWAVADARPRHERHLPGGRTRLGLLDGRPGWLRRRTRRPSAAARSGRSGRRRLAAARSSRARPRRDAGRLRRRTAGRPLRQRRTADRRGLRRRTGRRWRQPLRRQLSRADPGRDLRRAARRRHDRASPASRRAASAIITKGVNVAGIGGFSGRESQVTVKWLAQEIRSGNIRWVLVDGTGSGGLQDGRTGSSQVIAAVAQTCTKVSYSSSSSSGGTLYDCQGKADALLSAL